MWDRSIRRRPPNPIKFNPITTPNNNRPASSLARTRFYSLTAYRVAGQTLSLDDLEHGLLRHNRASPNPLRWGFWSPQHFVGLKDVDDDPRAAWAVPLDSRIHFALNCGARSCPAIRYYEAEGLDEALDGAAAAFFQGTEGGLGCYCLAYDGLHCISEFLDLPPQNIPNNRSGGRRPPHHALTDPEVVPTGLCPHRCSHTSNHRAGARSRDAADDPPLAAARRERAGGGVAARRWGRGDGGVCALRLGAQHEMNERERRRKETRASSVMWDKQESSLGFSFLVFLHCWSASFCFCFGFSPPSFPSHE